MDTDIGVVGISWGGNGWGGGGGSIGKKGDIHKILNKQKKFLSSYFLAVHISIEKNLGT